MGLPRAPQRLQLQRGKDGSEGREARRFPRGLDLEEEA